MKHFLIVLVIIVGFSITLAQDAFVAGQTWQLMIGHETWFVELREESQGVWQAEGILNESGESYPVTLAPLSEEDREALELPIGEYWAFSASVYDEEKTDSGWAFKCVIQLPEAEPKPGESPSIIGRLLRYNITIAGPQLYEESQCVASQPSLSTRQ
jgi:hypothetical protein